MGYGFSWESYGGFWRVESDHDSLRGLSLVSAYPGLAPWAKLCRPSGAGFGLLLALVVPEVDCLFLPTALLGKRAEEEKGGQPFMHPELTVVIGQRKQRFSREAVESQLSPPQSQPRTAV
jgi:hypothetical protein